VRYRSCVLGLDDDAKDLPDNLRDRVRANGGLFSVLGSVCPALAAASRVARRSVSSGSTPTRPIETPYAVSLRSHPIEQLPARRVLGSFDQCIR
jgi:hypothetical protein